MNNDIFEGKWKQLKGNAQEKWGKLTNDEINEIEGKRDRLEGKLQEKYGHTKEEAKKEVDNFLE